MGTLMAKRNAAIKALAIPALDWDGNIPGPRPQNIIHARAEGNVDM
jgi:hypothetical protein